MVEYCYDCGNKIKRGHNKKWNLRPHKAKHIDDVCECIEPVSQYSKEGREAIAKCRQGRYL